MSTQAILVALGISLLLVGVIVAAGARELTDNYEQRRRVQALGVALVIAAVWCLAAAAVDRSA